jgi:hypothetical protein
MGSQSPHLDNWITNGNTYKTNDKEKLHRFAPTKQNTYDHKMNDNISMDRTISGPMNAGS